MISFHYINKNFKQFSTYDEALKLLKKLVSFFELLNYLPNADTLLEIIEDNQLFFESIQLIVNKHKSQIISGDIENVFSNSAKCHLGNNYGNKATDEG